MKPEYRGEAFNLDGILDMLRGQGLEIEDDAKARRVLSNVSYTRLKSYLVPLMEDRRSHRFRPGASFDYAYALYGFDRRLRELIFHEMEKIEISIRTQMAYACNAEEMGYWFLNPAHFKSQKGFERIVKHLKMELERSDNEAIRNFYDKYSNEFPPSWLTLEAASMGTLVTMYECLGDEKIKQRIASHYGMSPLLFLSWIRHLLALRNDCAHHNRVWNKAPGVKAMLPEYGDGRGVALGSGAGVASDGGFTVSRPFPRLSESDRHHLYLSFCIIKYFVDTIKPENSFSARLRILINNFPMINASLMGFPRDWSEQSYW